MLAQNKSNVTDHRFRCHRPLMNTTKY